MSAIKVMIDPGHGGTDPGAVADPLIEKVLNMELAIAIRDRLIKDGFSTEMTRLKDVYIKNDVRAAMANEWGADYYVAVHHNAFKTAGANGFEVLYYDSGKRIAEDICWGVSNETLIRDRGPKQRKGLTVLRRTRMPAVLIEAGFITSTRDRELFLLDRGKRKTFYDVIGYYVSQALST